MDESLIKYNQEDEEQQAEDKRWGKPQQSHGGLPRWVIIAIVGSAVLSFLSLTILIATLVVVKTNPAVKFFNTHQVRENRTVYSIGYSFFQTRGLCAGRGGWILAPRFDPASYQIPRTLPSA
jgi:hypothetical protein